MIEKRVVRVKKGMENGRPYVTYANKEDRDTFIHLACGSVKVTGDSVGFLKQAAALHNCFIEWSEEGEEQTKSSSGKLEPGDRVLVDDEHQGIVAELIVTKSGREYIEVFLPGGEGAFLAVGASRITAVD